MTAVVYTRQSLDKTGAGLAVARQREACEQLCVERGWPVLRVLTDNDKSASNGKKRPAYEQLLELVDAGAVEVVVVWHVDRLVRRLADLESVIERFVRAKVRLITVSGDVDLGTDSGRLVARILASVASAEVERKGARQRAAQAQAAAQGRRVGGRRPFGYEQDGVTVRSVEAKAVRDGYDAVLAGVPLAGVARDWNERGLTPGQGRRDGTPSVWRHDNVRNCLLNPRNAGIRAYNGEEVGPAVWPGLVPEETYRAVVALIKDPDRGHAPATAKALLSGVALCGRCGETVWGSRGRTGRRGYRCSVSTAHGSRSAEPVEDFVERLVVGRLTRPDAAQLLHAPADVDTKQVRQDGLAARARLNALALDYADGVLTGSQLRAATERLLSRIGELEGQLAEAGRVDVLGSLIGVEDTAAAWRALPLPRQRAVVDTLLTVRLLPPGRGTRTFRPETVQYEWKGAA